MITDILGFVKGEKTLGAMQIALDRNIGYVV